MVVIWWRAADWLVCCYVAWTLQQYFDYSDYDSPTDSGTFGGCCALTWQSTVTVIMSGLGQGSAIWAHRAQAQQMLRSHDTNGSLPMNMDSLSVMDLDLSISLDVFSLRAFDKDNLITRMLPGSTPCKLRLMLPDSQLGTDGFHNIIIDNLATSPTWRSSHISPADITALRRRWPKAVFKTLSHRAPDVERLCWDARKRSDRAFRHSAPGFCVVCVKRVDSALDAHMVAFHLELAQLWRCTCRMVRGVEGLGSCLFGTFDGEAWGFHILCPEERGKALSALDHDPQRLAERSTTRCFGDRGGCTTFSRGGTSPCPPIPGLQGSVSSSGAQGRRHSTTLILLEAGYGHRPAHSAADLHSGAGGASWSSVFWGGAPHVQQPSQCVSFPDKVTMLGDAASSVCSPEPLILPVVEEEVIEAPVGEPIGYQSATSSGILAVLVAGRRWRYGRGCVVFSIWCGLFSVVVAD